MLELINYRPWNQKACEDVPYSVECCRDNCGNVAIWCHCNGHHPVKCEVHECEVHEKKIPQELLNRPVKANETIHDDPIYNSLKEYVWNLNQNLYKLGKKKKLATQISYIHCTTEYFVLPVPRHKVERSTSQRLSLCRIQYALRLQWVVQFGHFVYQ